MKNSADDDVSTLEAYETLITSFELADLLGEIVHVEKEVKAKPQTTATSNVNEVYAKILIKIIASILSNPDQNVCDSATIHEYCVQVCDSVCMCMYVYVCVCVLLCDCMFVCDYFCVCDCVTV